MLNGIGKPPDVVVLASGGFFVNFLKTLWKSIEFVPILSYPVCYNEKNIKGDRLMDDQWVEQLARNNRSALLSFLQRHVANREDAEDLLQDVFMSCYRHKDSFDPERCSETAWLFVIAKNRLKQYYRDQKPVSSLEELAENGERIADWSAQEAIALMECRDLVAKLLLTLDERSRTVLILRYFQQLDSQQIAQRMGLSPVNVRVIQSRAIASLRQAMEQMDT